LSPQQQIEIVENLKNGKIRKNVSLRLMNGFEIDYKDINLNSLTNFEVVL